MDNNQTPTIKQQQNDEDQPQEKKTGYQIFIGAVNPKMTQEYFEDYFTKYGKIIEARLMRDKITKKFRGFGFVTFEEEISRNEVLKVQEHVLMDKKVDVKVARSREETNQVLQEQCTRKLYVTGINPKLTKNIKVKYNTKSGNDFAFVLFKSKEDFEKSLEKGETATIEGVEVTLERTLLRDELKRTQMEEADKRRKKKKNKTKRKESSKSSNDSNRENSKEKKKENSSSGGSKKTKKVTWNQTENTSNERSGTTHEPQPPQEQINTTLPLYPQNIPPYQNQNPNINLNFQPQTQSQLMYNPNNVYYSLNQTYHSQQQPVYYGHYQQPQFIQQQQPFIYNQLQPQPSMNPNFNLALYQYHQNVSNQNFHDNSQIYQKVEEKEKVGENFNLEATYTKFSDEHLSDVNSISTHSPLAGFEPIRFISEKTQSEKPVVPNHSVKQENDPKRFAVSSKSNYNKNHPLVTKSSNELERQRFQAILDQDYLDEAASVMAQKNNFVVVNKDNDNDDDFFYIEENSIEEETESKKSTVKSDQFKRLKNTSKEDDYGEFLMGFKVVDKSKNKKEREKYISEEADLFCKKEDNKIVKSTWKNYNNQIIQCIKKSTARLQPSQSRSLLEDFRQEQLRVIDFPLTLLDDLKKYFSGYQSFLDVSIVKNKKKNSKGFGYVKFGKQEDAKKAIGCKHKIFGKMFRVRELMSKTKLDADKESEMRRKVFVGGISKTTSESHLEAYFSKFGEIEDILVNRSAKTGASKGCAFILFKKESVAQGLIEDPEKHIIDSKLVECKSSHKKSKDKSKSSKPSERHISHYHEFRENREIREETPAQILSPSPMIQVTPSRRHGGTDVEIKRHKNSSKRVKSTMDSILSRCCKTYQNCNPSNILLRWGNNEHKSCDENNDSLEIGGRFNLSNFSLKKEDTSDLRRMTFFDRSRVNYWKLY